MNNSSKVDSFGEMTVERAADIIYNHLHNTTIL